MNLRFLYSTSKYFLHQHVAAAPTPPRMHIKSLSGCSVHLASALGKTMTLHTELSNMGLRNIVRIIAAATILVWFGTCPECSQTISPLTYFHLLLYDTATFPRVLSCRKVDFQPSLRTGRLDMELSPISTQDLWSSARVISGFLETFHAEFGQMISSKSPGHLLQNDGGQLCSQELSVLQEYFGAVPQYRVPSKAVLLYSCFGFYYDASAVSSCRCVFTSHVQTDEQNSYVTPIGFCLCKNL